MNLFPLIGKHFWLLALGMSVGQYLYGMRSLASRKSDDPRSGREAIVLRRWFAIASALPWAVMGWGILVGGVPGIWYYFRPQDRNPYVLVWFAIVFLIAVYFAFWVFFRDGARKVVLLQPIDLRWHRSSFRGSAGGTVTLTERRVKLFAAAGPLWIAAWIWLVSWMDAPLPK